MRSLTRSLAALVVVALTACSGGHSSAPVPTTQATNMPTTPLQTGAALPLAYGQNVLANAAFLGSSNLATVDFGVLVKMRDPDGLARYARDANDPNSGLYHQFLTPDQIADRFGASKADFDAVRSYFASKGLATMGWRQRELLRVVGPQATVESALGAKFGDFSKNGRQFHALRSFPGALATLPIAALVGTENYAQIVKGPHRAATSPGSYFSGYSPQQIARAFDYNGAYNLGYTGAGVNVGIIGTGPILPDDFAAYKKTFRLTGASTITQVNVTDAGGNIPNGPASGYSQTTFSPPPPTTDSCTGPLPACNPEDFEAQLDTQQVAGLARDANVLFYLGYTTGAYGSTQAAEGISLTNYEVQQAISDNKADILSLSYGIGELDDVGGDFNLTADKTRYDPATSVGPIQFATLAAMGVAVFVSSGDTGAYNCSRDASGPTTPSTNVDTLCVSYPATDPNVVAIGGVNAPLADDGHLVGPITGWGAQTGGFAVFSSSGGGVARYFPTPPYQVGAVGVNASGRNTPDISLLADSYTGAATVINARYSDAQIFGAGGTSVAAPEAAAMWALVLQACKQNAATCAAKPGTGGISYRLGNPDATFYALYANPTSYAAAFTDVHFGDNSQLPGCTDPGTTGATPCPTTSPATTPTPLAGYQAGAGYDRITGIGAPAGRAMIKAIVGI